jgi:DNA-binding NtrC family response regulator
MNNKSKINIIIIDDIAKAIDPLVVKLKELYEQVYVFNKSDEAINHIYSSSNKTMIVLLDIRFPQGEPNGHQVLKIIRDISELIPVIIISAYDSRQEDFTDFLNNHAFSFISRATPYETIIDKIKEAEYSLKSNVALAISEWINRHGANDQNMPYLIERNGKKYTLKEILNEIQLRTNFGLELELKINTLTIDLLNRKKESFND